MKFSCYEKYQNISTTLNHFTDGKRVNIGINKCYQTDVNRGVHLTPDLEFKTCFDMVSWNWV